MQPCAHIIPHFNMKSLKIPYNLIDAPPNSMMDSTASPKVKTMKGKGVGARSLAHSTSGVGGVLEIRDGTRKRDKQANYSLKPRPGLGGNHHLPPYSIFCA